MSELISPRTLGKSDIAVSPLGMGGWTMGGPFFSGEDCVYPTGKALGYGKVDDRVSIRAIHCALDQGITFFDTADAYGAGHGESILGEALKHTRNKAVIATKFGNTYDEKTKELTGRNIFPEYIRLACDASLRRLQTDWIDLYQLHLSSLTEREACSVADTLESLCEDGLIRAYGWSTDDPKCAEMFGNYPNAVAVQHDMNIFRNASEMLSVCRTHQFASINRCPLAMGFLSGKFNANSQLPEDDIRAKPPEWLPYFEEGGKASSMWSDKLDQVKEILKSDGRSLVQGAIAWLWSRGHHTIPIPGARNEIQVEENAKAMQFGALTDGQLNELDDILGRTKH